ncbi:MAG TPA: hypothetical protein VIH35_03450 [Kiritimatiellia bacterium]
MLIAADTHVHLYPFYDAGQLFGHARRNLAALAPSSGALVVMLTERSDCRVFRALRDRTLRPTAGWTVETCGDQHAVYVRSESGQGLFLVAGRQINTRERIEVLALTADLDVPDGLPIDEVLPRVRESGAVPVLAWAPGKWFSGRGKIVERLIDTATRGGLLLGDTSLRPTVWPEPELMKRGQAHGLAILAGSDPLPFAGEERRAGTYGVALDVAFDAEHPAVSVRAAMLAPLLKVTRIGRRCGPFDTAARLFKNSRAKSG